MKQASRRGLLPAGLLSALLLGGPLAYCCYAAFTDMVLTGRAGTSFTGFDNFAEALADRDFRDAVAVTAGFVGVSVAGQNALGLAFAATCRRASRVTRRVVTGAVFTAWLVPEVVAGYVMLAFLREEGTLSGLLGLAGVPARDWLFSAPLLAVSLANVWRGTAFSMLVYSGALAAVDQDVLEAATVDGAGFVRRFRHITLPLIRRAVATNLALTTSLTVASFGLVYVMTRGGPGNRTRTLPIYLYEQAFQLSRIGYAAAVALVMLLLGGLLSAVHLRAGRAV